MRLITIGVSHYCEKARWALDRAGLSYAEEPHPPLISWWRTWRAGAGDTVPVLVTGDAVLGDSTEILQWVDAQAGLGLYPESSRAEVCELEDLFDETLGPHVRRWAYFHVLRDKALTRALLTGGTPRGERLLFGLARPLIVTLMRKGMNITPESAARSRQKVEDVLGRVDALLADGRPWLVGDRFTAADLSLAALGAPLLGIDDYGPRHPERPDVNLLPAALQAEWPALRARPSGAHILRLYRDERRAGRPAQVASRPQLTNGGAIAPRSS